MTSGKGGGSLVAVPFQHIWACDFEFRAEPGERPWPVCMVAQELLTGQHVRSWRDGLLALRQAPFDTGRDSLFVAYYASAELGCFLELGWSLPVNVLDLYAEHRVETNGLPAICGNTLLGALAVRGLAHLEAGEKNEMRRLVLEHTAWSEAERRSLLDYCASDVTALLALLPRMTDGIDWPRALLRGRYMAAVARMERTGVPIDMPMYQLMVENWPDIKQRLIAEVDRDFSVFDGISFKADRFLAYLPGSKSRGQCFHLASWRSTTTHSGIKRSITPRSCRCTNCGPR